jgi:hypothetical protein
MTTQATRGMRKEISPTDIFKSDKFHTEIPKIRNRMNNAKT